MHDAFNAPHLNFSAKGHLMHLIEMLAHRAVPAAGVSIGITRRCPLSCAHCSTSSTMLSEELPAEIFSRFVDSFSVQSHPRFMAMSGGEALLRPQLVKSLALKARESGTKSSVLSGMFFARQSVIPNKVKAAIQAVDHFSVSMDEFHEREVPRSNVFRVIRELLDAGKHLSIHIAGRDQHDPYPDELTSAVRRSFGDHVPMLVNTLSPFGRAKTFVIRNRRSSKQESDANPCTMAAWPVVGFDGVVAACGNDNLIGCVPSHLKLGDIRVDGWQDIKTRCETQSLPMALRTYGPEYLLNRFDKSSTLCGGGYCDTCIQLEKKIELRNAVTELMHSPGAVALSNAVVGLQVEMGAVEFAKRYSHPRFSELVLLGSGT